MKKFSTLLYTILLTGSAFAQIPNPSFESWTHSASSGGYDTPDGWGNTNPYTTIASTYTCEKGAPGPTGGGASYLKLTTKNCGVAVPGVAVTGNITPSGLTSYSISGGFAYNKRPATLSGQRQYMPSGSDHAHMIVFLSKWNIAANKRDTVAFTDQALGSMEMSWTAFSVTLNYYSGKLPDSAMIIFSSSDLPPATAVVGSYLYVDTIAFAGNVPSGVVTVTNNAAPTIIYPNPSTGNTSVFYYSVSGGNVTITLFDVTGKKLKELDLHASIGQNTFPVDVAGLLHGMYILHITNELGGVEEKKLIVE